MDFNWNSESMAGGAWRHGTGGQETKWSSYQCAGFSNENDPWLLRNDPFLAPEPYESSLDWPELGPRKEALALADHSLYCRQADEMSVVPLRVLTRIAHFTHYKTTLSAHTPLTVVVCYSCRDWAWPTGCALSSVSGGNVERLTVDRLAFPKVKMDPFYTPNDGVDYSQFLLYEDLCPKELEDMPSTSSAPPSNGPPIIDQGHMEWLETFGPIDYDIHPSDLDDTANNLDLDSWMKYLEDDEQPDPKNNMPLFPPTVVKDEADSYVPQCTAVPKKETATPIFNNYPVSIKEEIKDVKPFISGSMSPGLVYQNRFDPYGNDKPKRGRPKKIRVPEDQAKMSLNERRKAMNRDAALRYRERKKCELDELKREACHLEVNNQVLTEQASQLEQEIRLLKLRLHHEYDLKFDFLTSN
ncbi:atfs-1 [Pristionchus pacificus]|uniref:BZIP domain-containing protein n=1 Tax=Pristionchus pacificus TaxID=54126 RepID=A0A2A6CSC8_PRIPA|nr:atfs-1 [Pristionchus pacificus]|eukprot:PDM80986.1 hypothetical protein PRIPAC_35989 [Pristionchus pacificus]